MACYRVCTHCHGKNTGTADVLFPRESLVLNDFFGYRRSEYELRSVQLFKDLHDEKLIKAILSLNFALKCLTQANRRIRHHPLVITSDTTEQLFPYICSRGYAPAARFFPLRKIDFEYK